MFHPFKPNSKNEKVFGEKSKSCFSKLSLILCRLSHQP